jgi:predicted peptidase
VHRTLSLAAALVVSTNLFAQAGFQERSAKDASGAEFNYAVFVPYDRKPDAKLPVILFLHGAGESGTDNRKQLDVGLGPAVRKRERTFPFLVVFPQATKPEQHLFDTWYHNRPAGQRALAALDDAMKAFPADSERVYLTGVSMGGFGTWSLAHRDPKRWAAMVPICGGGNPTWAAALKDIPCWTFHGVKDESVPVVFTQAMVAALKKAGASPKYDEYPDVGHNSWDPAYATDALYEWMLAHKRKQ